MKIRTGGLDVFESGVVLSRGLADVEFFVSETPEIVVVVRLQKVEGRKPSIELKFESARRVVFTFFNPETFSFGTSEPVQIGALNMRALYVDLRLLVHGDFKSFQISYTFYIGEVVQRPAKNTENIFKQHQQIRGTPENWRTRHPRVYRYMEKKYVDEYFSTGRLMLSSFAKFAKHADEQRLDSDEGKTFLIHRTGERGGQTFIAEVDFGHDAYILCGSLLPSIGLMTNFGADSGIVIKDPVGFADSIGKALKGFIRGSDGPCSYQGRRIIEHDLGYLDLGPPDGSGGVSISNQDVLSQTLDLLMSSPDVYFLKDAAYVSQAEWRFVWNVDHPAVENIFIDAPESRQFCKRWEEQGVAVSFGKQVS